MKLSVCVLIARFHPYIGGTELQALRLSQVLRTKGVNVFVITQRLKNLKKFEEINGLKVYRLFSLGRGKFSSFIFMVSSLLFLIRRHKDYDIIHVHLASSPAIVAAIVGKLFNKKVLVKLGGSRQTGDLGTSLSTFLGRLKIRFLRRYGDTFICPSSELERELLQEGFNIDKIKKISNGVDIYQFRPITIEEKESIKKSFCVEGKKIAAFAGRLEQGKGLEILLKVWQEVIRVFPNCYLFVLGEGKIKRNLENLVEKLKITASVNFTGKVENVLSYFQTSDIFILPSFGEGMSNALLEAMSCGLAIITNKIGGVEDIIVDGKNGILIEPGDVDSLYRKILFLFNNAEIAINLGINARSTVEKGYSLSEISQRYLQLYNKILSED